MGTYKKLHKKIYTHTRSLHPIIMKFLVSFLFYCLSTVFSANIDDFKCYECSGNEFEVCEQTEYSLVNCASRLCVSIYQLDKNQVQRSCANNDDGLPKTGFGCIGSDNNVCYDFCGESGCNKRSFQEIYKRARPGDSESFSLRVFDIIGKVLGMVIMSFAVFRIVLSVFEKYSGQAVFEKMKFPMMMKVCRKGAEKTS